MNSKAQQLRKGLRPLLENGWVLTLKSEITFSKVDSLDEAHEAGIDGVFEPDIVVRATRFETPTSKLAHEDTLYFNDNLDQWAAQYILDAYESQQKYST